MLLRSFGPATSSRLASPQRSGTARRIAAARCSAPAGGRSSSVDFELAEHYAVPSNFDLADRHGHLHSSGSGSSSSIHRGGGWEPAASTAVGSVAATTVQQQHPHDEDKRRVAERSIDSTLAPIPTRGGAASPSGDTPKPRFSRVMLKVSGEALQGQHGHGVDPAVVHAVAREVKAAVNAGIEVAIVVGGGNYFRGATGAAELNLERATADYVGMLATVMNALQLQGSLEGLGVATRVQTAIEMREVAEPYIRRRAISHLEAKRVVIFGAGTGNPFFTTDTAAALRAAEINAQVLLKATKVDGVYDSDPKKNPTAKRYRKLLYREVVDQGLGVMDETAVTLCKENNIPVIVFDIMEGGNILNAAMGVPVGTVVCESHEQAASMDFSD